MSFWIFMLVAGAFGIIVGAALEKWDKNRVAAAVVDKLTAGAETGLTKVEQEIVAAYRKATGKVPAAAPAGDASASTASASPAASTPSV